MAWSLQETSPQEPKKKSSKKVEGDLTKSPQKEVSVIFSYNNFAFWRSKLWPTHQDYRRSYRHC